MVLGILVPQPRVEPKGQPRVKTPAVEALILNHWTTALDHRGDSMENFFQATSSGAFICAFKPQAHKSRYMPTVSPGYTLFSFPSEEVNGHT